MSRFYVANEYGSNMAGGKMFSTLEEAVKAAKTALKRRAASAARSQYGRNYVPVLDVIEQRPGYLMIAATVRDV